MACTGFTQTAAQPLKGATRSMSVNGFSRFTEPIGLPMYSASEAFEASKNFMTEL
jgi:hypothetical protein